jgi:hypothetical protein
MGFEAIQHGVLIAQYAEEFEEFKELQEFKEESLSGNGADTSVRLLH